MFTLLELVLIGIVSAVAGLWLWGFAFKRRQDWVKKKRAFAALAFHFKAGNPDSWFGRFFDDVAFGDIHDAVEELCEFAVLVEGDPAAFYAEFTKQFFNVLAGMAQDPAQLALIQARIKEATTPATTNAAA